MAENIEIQDEDEEDDDINCANVETKTTAQHKHPLKIISVRRRPVRRQFRLVWLGFGLLCGVQALLNIGLRLSLYSELIKENNNLLKNLNHLQSKSDNLTKDLHHTQSRYNNVTAELDELKRRLCEPHGFTFSGGVCYYYISTEWKTWEESRKYCRDRQSDLMIINSKEKQDFVNSVVNNQEVWLGLTDREKEGVWKWIDGTPLTSPTYWLPGDRNNSARGEDCVAFYNGFWDDRQCKTSYYHWICERVI